jgi:hypothetical protein
MRAGPPAAYPLRGRGRGAGPAKGCRASVARQAGGALMASPMCSGTGLAKRRTRAAALAAHPSGGGREGRTKTAPCRSANLCFRESWGQHGGRHRAAAGVDGAAVERSRGRRVRAAKAPGDVGRLPAHPPRQPSRSRHWPRRKAALGQRIGCQPLRHPLARPLETGAMSLTYCAMFPNLGRPSVHRWRVLWPHRDAAHVGSHWPRHLHTAPKGLTWEKARRIADMNGHALPYLYSAHRSQDILKLGPREELPPAAP